jgi:hypothetical protein
VGAYFFPANLGAKWTMRMIQQVYDNRSSLMKSDTFYSFERIVSDTGRSLQGTPILQLESSVPYRFGEELTAKTQPVEYYVDDSVVMAVFNHSIASVLNRYLLVNPLTVGAHWHEKTEDTAVAVVVSMNEPVSVPYGNFTNAMVVQTAVSYGELSRYFVPGVGLVKTVFRGVPPTAVPGSVGTLVVTSELMSLERGDESRSIRRRFGASATP